MASRPKSKPRPNVATLLSFLVPGLGQVYGAKPSRGAIVYGAYLLLLAILALLAPAMPAMWFLYSIAFWFVGARVVAGVDARAQSKKKKAQSSTAGLVMAALVAFVVAGQVSGYVIRQNLLEAFKIPSEGMSPSLLMGDHLFADKRISEPRRGDIIIFEFPDNRRQDFINRVIGLPGDLIETKKGDMYINDVLVERCKLGEVDGQVVYVERLDGRSYIVVVDKTETATDQQWRVSHGEYFVMGDNRSNSYDSRNWNAGRGAGVPLDHVQGRALFVWWATNRDRIGTMLDQTALPAALQSLAGELPRCGAQLSASEPPADESP
jgi:signal peptidase I